MEFWTENRRMEALWSNSRLAQSPPQKKMLHSERKANQSSRPRLANRQSTQTRNPAHRKIQTKTWQPYLPRYIHAVERYAQGKSSQSFLQGPSTSKKAKTEQKSTAQRSVVTPSKRKSNVGWMNEAYCSFEDLIGPSLRWTCPQPSRHRYLRLTR